MKKNCIKCGVSLDHSNTKWYRIKNYIHKCNYCSNEEKRERARELRRRDPSLANSRSIRSRHRMREEDPVGYTARQMRDSARKRAKALGLGYDLDVSFILSLCLETCPILGVEIKYGGGEKNNRSASLDRIDSFKGYTKDNVQVISMLANLMKANSTRDEQVKFAKWVLSQ